MQEVEPVIFPSMPQPLPPHVDFAGTSFQADPESDLWSARKPVFTPPRSWGTEGLDGPESRKQTKKNLTSVNQC